MPRRIIVEDLEPGMILSEPVVRPNGGVLLGKGCQLNQTFINKLRMMEIVDVIVEGEDQSDLDGLMLRVEKAISTDDLISKGISDKLENKFSEAKNNKIMQAIRVVAQKILIERKKKQIEALEVKE